MSQDPSLPVLHSGTQSNDIMSLCDTFCVADVTFCVHSVLQMSQDPSLSVLHSGSQSNDIMSLCDIIATEFEASTSCQTKDASALK